MHVSLIIVDNTCWSVSNLSLWGNRSYQKFVCSVVCVCACMHVYICMCIYTDIYMYMFEYICIQIYLCILLKFDCTSFTI